MNGTVVSSLPLTSLGKYTLASTSKFWKLELPLILLTAPHKDVLAVETRAQVRAHLGFPAWLCGGPPRES